MFEKFLSVNAGDFRQRYEGTYGFYKNIPDNKVMLVQLTSISTERCLFTDSKGVEYTLSPDVEREIGFEFIPPKAQWYNTDQGAYLVTRVAARQFQRGVSSKNIRVHFLMQGVFNPARVGFPVLEKIYLNKKTISEVGIKWDALPSVAISNQFALDINTKGVYLYDEKVGTYTRTGDQVSIKLKEPDLWRTELLDAFKVVGLTAEVA